MRVRICAPDSEQHGFIGETEGDWDDDRWILVRFDSGEKHPFFYHELTRIETIDEFTELGKIIGDPPTEVQSLREENERLREELDVVKKKIERIRFLHFWGYTKLAFPSVVCSPNVSSTERHALFDEAVRLLEE